MAAETSFDYYYGDESNQFSFYRIPRQLVTGERFKRLSMDAKLLYGLLLDRMSLSAKNGWYDEQGRVYIYYTLDEIQEDLNCGHDKATRMLVELDNGKNGFGLIERVRQGQGRPTKIYVKRFTTRAVPPPPPEPAPEPSPRPRLFSGQDCGKAAAQSAEKPQPRVRKNRSQDCGEVAAKTAEKSHQVILNQIKLISAILIHLSFHQVPRRAWDGWIDWSSGEKWMKLLAMRAFAANSTVRTWTR